MISVVLFLSFSCRFLVPVLVCLVIMTRVWFGLAALQARLATMALDDDTVEEGCNRLSHSDSLRSNNNEESLIKSKSQVPDLDINKEKRTQKFLLLILISHFVCIVPINILK